MGCKRLDLRTELPADPWNIFGYHTNCFKVGLFFRECLPSLTTLTMFVSNVMFVRVYKVKLVVVAYVEYLIVFCT